MSRVFISLLILVLISSSALSSWSGDISLKLADVKPITDSKYVLTINQMDGTVVAVIVEKLSTVQYALQGEIYKAETKPRLIKFFEDLIKKIKIGTKPMFNKK